MWIYYISIICILIMILIYIVVKHKQERKRTGKMFEDAKGEMTAALEKQNENFNREIEKFYPKEVVIEALNKLKEEKNNTIIEYEQKIFDLNSYIKNIEARFRNFGEINTHKILTDLKKDLINRNKITSSQMRILSNVFVPFRANNGEVHSRQIDHLIIMNKGIYIIESKYWRGNIMYGLCKKHSMDFGFILDSLYPEINDTEEKTIVFIDSNSETNDREMKVVSYDDPAKQVKKTAWTLNQLLKEYNMNIFITPIIYFGHKEKKFKDFTETNSPQVFDNENDLCNFLESQLLNSTMDYSIEELEAINKIVEKVNYFPK
ncbi:nuclease-related domain-containing protein [Ornithinibacillus xuwenensis]|uniref:Nuclease-related domain-containing protein n=1 Tax=Ornithinibacillus xuwenensis TaxID=3144668 RepID=A0ABU9XC31_9BACI